MKYNSSLLKLPNFEIKRVIGSGSFGYVFEAVDHNNNDRRVALKRVEKVGNQMSREYEILFEIKECDQVVKILDFFYSRTENNKLIQNIVFEYMDDNLENRIQEAKKAHKNISELSIKNIMYQIMKGLRFCHSKGIAHRDLKPQCLSNLSENILIDKQDNVKLCDFGSSKVISKEGMNTPYIVSRYYRAPELVLCVTNYTTAIDIWAAGAIMAELVLKEPMFQGKSEGDQLFAMFKIMGSPTQKDLETITKGVSIDQKLIKEFKTYKKVNIKEMFHSLRHPDDFVDLLEKMLVYVPANRITAEDALKHPFFAEVYDEQK